MQVLGENIGIFYNVGISFQAYEAQYLFLKRFVLLAKYTVKTSIWKTTHYNLSGKKNYTLRKYCRYMINKETETIIYKELL